MTANWGSGNIPGLTGGWEEIMKEKSGLIAIVASLCILHGCGGDEATTAPGVKPTTGGIQRTESVPGAAVFIITPINGATVNSPVTVKFGISGMAVAVAGEPREGAGHHHLLVDAGLTDPNGTIPNSKNHLHFGKGQTETTLELAPGPHTLQLVLGDYMHMPHEPPVVSKLTVITVE
jgi:hypothetical protein